MTNDAVLKTIGVCGSQASGKTVYLCMLTEELRKHTKLRLFPTDEPTKRYVKDRLQWFRGGTRAPGTSGPERLRFSVEKDETGLLAKLTRFAGSLLFSPFQLHFDVIDTAGGHFEDVANLSENPGAQAMKSLIDSSAVLLWFIDPMMLESPSRRGEVEDQAEILYRHLKDRSPNKRPQRIAAILTKQDYFKGDAAERMSKPQEYLRKMLGGVFGDLEKLLGEEAFSAFGVSAWGDFLGGQEGSDHCDPPARLEPRGVVEPFRWAIKPLMTPAAQIRFAFSSMLKHHPARAAAIGGVLLAGLLGGGAAGTSAWNYSELPSGIQPDMSEEELLAGFAAHDAYLNGWYPAHMLHRNDVRISRQRYGEELDWRALNRLVPQEDQPLSPKQLVQIEELAGRLLTEAGRAQLKGLLSNQRQRFIAGSSFAAWQGERSAALEAAGDLDSVLSELALVRRVIGVEDAGVRALISSEEAQRIRELFENDLAERERSVTGLKSIARDAGELSGMLISDEASVASLEALRKGALHLLEGVTFTLVLDEIEISEDQPAVSDSIGSPDPYLTITTDEGTANTPTIEDAYSGTFSFRLTLSEWSPQSEVVLSLNDSDLTADDRAGSSIALDRWDVLAPDGVWLEATGWRQRVFAEDLPGDVAQLVALWLK